MTKCLARPKLVRSGFDAAERQPNKPSESRAFKWSSERMGCFETRSTLHVLLFCVRARVCYCGCGCGCGCGCVRLRERVHVKVRETFTHDVERFLAFDVFSTNPCLPQVGAHARAIWLRCSRACLDNLRGTHSAILTHANSCLTHTKVSLVVEPFQGGEAPRKAPWMD